MNAYGFISKKWRVPKPHIEDVGAELTKHMSPSAKPVMRINIGRGNGTHALVWDNCSLAVVIE
jgi:hypothetical protein